MQRLKKVFRLLLLLLIILFMFNGCSIDKNDASDKSSVKDTGNNKDDKAEASSKSSDEVEVAAISALEGSDGPYTKTIGGNLPFKAIYRTAVAAGKIYVIIDPWFIDENNPDTFLNAGRLYEYNTTADIWTEKSRLPENKFGFYFTAVNGKLYAVNGKYINNELLAPDHIFQSTVINPDLRMAEDDLNYSVTMHEYDPSTDKWTMKTGMNTQRKDPSFITADGVIYAAGGSVLKGGSFENVAVVEAYVTTKDEWVRKKDMPTACSPLLIALADTIYASDFFKKTFEVYNISTDNWTQIPSSEKIPAEPFGGFSVGNGKVYIIHCTGQSVMYDPDINLWEDKSILGKGRGDAATIAFDDKIFFFGGWYASNASNLSDLADCYNTKTDIWSKMANMQEQKWDISVAELDGSIYLFGGRSAMDNRRIIEYLDTVEIYHVSD